MALKTDSDNFWMKNHLMSTYTKSFTRPICYGIKWWKQLGWQFFVSSVCSWIYWGLCIYHGDLYSAIIFCNVLSIEKRNNKVQSSPFLLWLMLKDFKWCIKNAINCQKSLLWRFFFLKYGLQNFTKLYISV